MFNKTPARKRKREIKKLLVLTVVVLLVVGIFGGGGYYLFTSKLKKPLYVSPLSNKALNVSENTPLEVLKQGLKQKKIAFTDVKVASNSSLLVSLKDGGVVTFSSEKDILTQVSSLQFILSRLTMEGKLFSQLDLRFDKPVIVLKK